MNTIRVILKHGLIVAPREIDVEIDGGSKEERAQVIELAKVAVMNDWMTEIEETEEEADSEQK